MKMSSKRKTSEKTDAENMKIMFLDQVVSLKYVFGWGAAILVTLMPLSYGLGRWMQRIDDKFVFHQKQEELNEMRTQLSLEFNDKVTKLERENSRLETLLEACQEKEVKNGK